LKPEPRRILVVVVVALVVALGLYFAIGQNAHMSDTVVCQWGTATEGYTIESYITSGGSTLITGTFFPFATLNSTVTATGYPPASVGVVTTVTTATYGLLTTVYSPTQTCTYVSG
jgi:hypothetical protein